MRHARPGAALLPVLLLVSACHGTLAAGSGPAASTPADAAAEAAAPYADRIGHAVPPHARTLPARPGPTLRDAREATVVPGEGPGRVWAGVLSPEVTYDQAARFCAGLPPWRGRPFRVPTLAELDEAPLERFADGTPGSRLWTATPVPDPPDLRWSVDPTDRRLEAKHPGQGIGLRVLCVAQVRP